MRNALIDELTTLAVTDPSVVLIVNDVGFSVIEPFQRQFPQRFINAGVAEANMIGVAAGLALTGHRVFVYAIAPFTTYRCMEQIRLDLCRTKLPVTLVGLGGGFTYGQLGTTHHPTEDVAMLRALPGMRVLAPCDALETRALVPYLGAGEGPIYLRLEKAGQSDVHTTLPAVGPGCSVRVRISIYVTSFHFISFHFFCISPSASCSLRVKRVESAAREEAALVMRAHHMLHPLLPFSFGQYAHGWNEARESETIS